MTIACEQIYFTSAENRADDDTPGFGIRAVSDGLTADDARTIAAACVAGGYVVDPALAVTAAELDASPDALTRFEPQFVKRDLMLPDGSRVEVVGRTVYLGADYDYFADGATQSQGNGFNSFTHLFVSRGPAPLELLTELDTRGLWRPASTDISAPGVLDEIRGLLTGAPPELHAVDIAVGESAPAFGGCTPQAALMLDALTRRAADAGNQPKTIIITEPGTTADTVMRLGSFPAPLTAGIRLTTSVEGQYTVPDPFDVAIIARGTRSAILTDNFLTVELDRMTRNFDDAGRIQALMSHVCASGDRANLASIYAIFERNGMRDPDGTRLTADIALHTALPLTPDTIAGGTAFPRSLKELGLTAEETGAVVGRLCAMTDALLLSQSSRDVADGLTWAAAMLREFPDSKPAGAAAVGRLGRIFFLRGAGSYLGRIVTDSTAAATLAALLPPESMADKPTFLAALSTSDNPDVWFTLIDHYFRGVYAPELPALLDSVAASRMPTAAKEATVGRLFPLGSQMSYLSDLAGWYARNPAQILEIPGPIHELAAASRTECFSRYLGPDTPDEVMASMRDSVTAYFRPRIDSNPNEAMQEIIDMAGRMTPAAFARLDALDPLVTLWLDKVSNSPTPTTATTIDSLRRTGIKLPDGLRDRMNTLQCLLTGRVPAEVATATMVYAASLPSTEPEFFGRLARKWLASSPGLSHLKEVAGAVTSDRAAMGGALLNAVWQSESRSVAQNRERCILAVADNLGWTDSERADFVNSVRDSQMAAVIRRSDSVVGRLFRKLF